MRTLGLEMSGQSTTAALAIALGAYQDPAIKVPIAIILQWLQLTQQYLTDMPGVASLWRLQTVHLRSKKQYKWHSVRGPMGATIATLLDLGWDPDEWDQWTDTMGHCWKLTHEEDLVLNMKTCDPLLRQLRKDLQAQLWNQSTMAELLQGRQPWIVGPQKQWKKYMEQGKREEATTLIRIVADGLWTSQRVAAAATAAVVSCDVPAAGSEQSDTAGPSDSSCQRDKQSPHCRLCGAPVQCQWHTAWACPKILASEAAKGSEALVAQATACKGTGAALWIRGLTLDIFQKVPPPVSQEQVAAWPAGPWRPGHYYTDASGGKHAEDPDLRRVGVAACSLASFLTSAGDLCPEVSAYLQAPLCGMTQSTNRGELYAIILVLEMVVPCLDQITTIYTDSQYCCDGYAAGAQRQKAAFNDDLWARFFGQVARHQGRVSLIKVKSHLTLQDAAAGGILLKDLVGNAMADQAAKLAAADFEVPESIAEKVQGEQQGAMKILRHLVAANVENLRQLQALGLRDPAHRSRQPTAAPKPSPLAANRGHKLHRLSGNRWRCSLCLAVRKSKLAHRWPKRCSQLFATSVRQAPMVRTASLLQPSVDLAEEATARSEQSGTVAEIISSPLVRQRVSALDDSEAEDVPSQEPESYSEGHQAEPHPMATIQHASVAAHPPWFQVQSQSWWNRIGHTIAADDLRIGGATIHHSHCLSHFGNDRHRLVICTQCGGSTSGSRSELLAVPCRRFMGATRERQLRRMTQGRWPDSHQAAFGRAELSLSIRFSPVVEGLLIHAAAHSACSHQSSAGLDHAASLPL